MEVRAYSKTMSTVLPIAEIIRNFVNDVKDATNHGVTKITLDPKAFSSLAISLGPGHVRSGVRAWDDHGRKYIELRYNYGTVYVCSAWEPTVKP